MDEWQQATNFLFIMFFVFGSMGLGYLFDKFRGRR